MDFTEWQEANRQAGIERGSKAENDFIKQFGGHLTPDKSDQYRDIDIRMGADGDTYSIKDQVAISKKTGNISFEMELINSKTKHRQPGNYASCEADKYGIGLTYKDEPYWWIYDVKEFKEWLDKNKDRFKTKTLLQWRIDDNRRQGRV
ncbi:hypothetical protein, partial [Herbiconiux daphne]